MQSNSFTRALSRYLGAVVLGVSLLATDAKAVDYDEFPQARNLVNELVTEHGMDRDWVEALIQDAVYQQGIIDAITRPAEKKFPWYRYRRIFITDSKIDLGLAFWKRNEQAISRAEQTYGVDGAVIVAIIGVETRYGMVTGRHRVIDSLVTLTLGYPRRSEFFKSELIEFLELVNEENINPFSAKGSYAGAMGIPQFISSSYRNYAVDFNQNGQRNLIGEVDDAIGSVANYLKLHGWRAGGTLYDDLRAEDESALENARTKGLKNNRIYADIKAAGIRFATDEEPEANDQFGIIKYEVRPGEFVYRAGYPNFFVITAYNRSTLYAMAVAELSEALAAARYR